MKDMIIIGAGPAGMSAAIYGVRAGLDLVLFERYAPGGQVMNTHEVENYPGFVEPVGGFDLVNAMENQARRLGAVIESAEIVSIENKDTHFEIKDASGTIHQSKTVIAATGSSYKKLNIPGEIELIGRGVSYCATCDGAFFRNKTVCVIGGGNTALEEALFLTRFASKIYLIHRREEYRAEKILQIRVNAEPKIVQLKNCNVTRVNGTDKVTSVSLIGMSDCSETQLDLDGVFIFVGYDANTELFPKELKDEYGQLIVDINMRTPVDGLFAAGDIRSESKRQIVMAAADGATAAMNAYEFISHFRS